MKHRHAIAIKFPESSLAALTCQYSAWLYGFGILFFLVRGDGGITEGGHHAEHKGGTISFSSLARCGFLFFF